MYIYQRINRYFAQFAEDISDIASLELEELGGCELKSGYRGKYFKADPAALYRINYQSRLINRVLAPLINFDCHSDKYLYQTASKIQWDDFLNHNQTFAVFASVANSKIRHSKYASLRLKDAIVDWFQQKYHKRPSVDTRNPDIWFNLHIHHNKATISVDTSGGSLHRRGYRTQAVKAPMTETLAAAIIEYSGWNGETPLYDPFCGSGTLLIEAWLKTTQTPVSILRKKFGFQRLPDYKQKVWQQVRDNCLEEQKTIKSGWINGSDIDGDAVKMARDNCKRIDPKGCIDIRKQDVLNIQNLENQTIICNPPYGIRMGDTSKLQSFYKQFGDFLKQKCKGSTAFVYFGERELIKYIGLKPSFKKPLSNGGLDGRLVKFEMY